MALLSRLWLAMLTDNTDNAGTDDQIVLIVNDGVGTDAVHHTIRDTLQRDQERGEANLYELSVSGRFLHTDRLNASSVRVGIRGEDEWRPENVFLWGRTVDEEIVPLAIDTDIRKRLSTDAGPANVVPDPSISIPIMRVRIGNDSSNLSRLLVLMSTAASRSAGTDSKIELQVSAGGAIAVDFEFPLTPQPDQERAQANWYWVPVGNPLAKEDITNISLRIKGDDMWTPASFFVFGVDSRDGTRPFWMVPLVHEPEWPHGSMSTDSDEGKASVSLDIVPSPPPPPLPTAPTQLVTQPLTPI